MKAWRALLVVLALALFYVMAALVFYYLQGPS